MLIIKFYTFIIFAVCTDDSLEMDTTNGVCICAVGYYQTATGSTTAAPTCNICPVGITTTGTNSQDTSECGKNTRIIIPIDWH